MLHLIALLAASASVQPIVSVDWLAAHLTDPQVHVVYVGSEDQYKAAHIPGARLLDHMATVQMSANGHRLAPNDVLVRALTKAGIADAAHVVLYGDSPMEIGWVHTAIAAVGHGDHVSWLDGNLAAWEAGHHPTETTAPPPGAGPLTLRSANDFIVDAAWVRSHLDSTATKILDVRSDQEWKGGHIPNATLVLWQELFADRKTMTFKTPEEIRALLAKAGVTPGQDVVTYCAIGMRASLMAWTARAAGVPAKIYLGSWQDWSSDPKNPIVKP